MSHPTPELEPADVQQLQLLEIGYYVLAAFSAVGGLVALGFFGFGVFLASAGVASAHGEGLPGAVFGAFFGFFAFLFFLVCASTSAAYFCTARLLRRRTHRIVCLVVAGLSAMNAPIGTLVGIFTFLVLSKPAVVAAFDRAVSTATTGPALDFPPDS